MMKHSLRGTAHRRCGASTNLCGVYRFALFLFILSLCLLPSLTAQQLPATAGFVNDFAGVMNAADKEAVESLAAAIKEKTGAELVLATVNSYTPYGSLDEYSLALAEKWGIGEKGKDNGVLFILAMDEREIKIEVGYGLEGAIPDSAAGRILDTVVIPAFRNGDFSGGLLQGYRSIAAYVAKENGIDLAELDLTEAETDHSTWSDYFPIILVIIFIIINIVFSLLMPGRRRGLFWIGRTFSSGSFSRSGGGFRGFGGGSFGGGGAFRRF